MGGPAAGGEVFEHATLKRLVGRQGGLSSCSP
jgi:hypothetical protein